MIGFLGGTGPEGRGLAMRLAVAGEKVLLGSRDEGRAREAAESLLAHVPPGAVGGAVNADVARQSEVVFVVVPYDAQRNTLESLRNELAGKIVVDVVAPLFFSKGRISAIRVEEGSAAQQAQAILPDSTVIAAFQTISAQDLLVYDSPLDTDVVVCGDDASAKQTIMALADRIAGVRAVDGGGLENARYVEDFTALLLNINRIYKARSKIKIVGI
jgi:NADPH-dependent F420 reductase